MTIPKKYEEDILIYAFRYVLGRRSYAISIMQDILTMNWEDLSDNTKDLIKKEIIENKAIWETIGNLTIDESGWSKFLALD